MMMMTGDHTRSNRTVQIPSWDYNYPEDPTAQIYSPINGPDAPSDYKKVLAALQRYLPSNKEDAAVPAEDGCSEFDFPVDAFSCDSFRMFDFKVKKCGFSRSHDWTECPFAHPGEKARRRDPRRYSYSGSSCPDFRKGVCKKGDSCDYAHGVFECWLHPSRYRTQLCKDGIHCRRRVCFFAHTPEQLRVLPSSDESPVRLGQDSFASTPSGSPLYRSSPVLYSPPLSSPATGSPPVSPTLNQLSESMRRLEFNRKKMGIGLSGSPPGWGLGQGPFTTRPKFTSLPTTPVRTQFRGGLSPFEIFGSSWEEEPALERVESGKQLRERIYAKLVEENSLDRFVRENSVGGSGSQWPGPE
ncbi:zinc finger CCCH domain-containing protein 23-like [Andrographis paniculata]|uniref:zinc finger CCCH domain-containing protein 23-like n=1 Tax=Andrographis paniculata TaxID=175694 RepID=UPI0021E6D7DF|nr:zinc finger CCCH domain-containing protein 23-like [Andrographis paniculata]